MLRFGTAVCSGTGSMGTGALTGNAYEDMRYTLESNNVCTGWQPQHRIQFAHSKGDTVVPYGNYLAFRDAHPDGENEIYRIDDTFSTSDHLKTGSTFMTKLAIDFIDCFEWIDAAQPTDIHTVQGSKFKVIMHGMI